MSQRHSRVGVFAGTFDPPTKGHLNIIDRSRRLFDKTVVAVGVNPEKEPLFSAEERVEMLQELIGKAADIERWLAGMGRLVRTLEEDQ